METKKGRLLSPKTNILLGSILLSIFMLFQESCVRKEATGVTDYPMEQGDSDGGNLEQEQDEFLGNPTKKEIKKGSDQKEVYVFNRNGASGDVPQSYNDTTTPPNQPKAKKGPKNESTGSSGGPSPDPGKNREGFHNIYYMYIGLFPNDTKPNRSVNKLYDILESVQTQNATKVLAQLKTNFIIVKNNKILQDCLVNYLFYLRTGESRYLENMKKFESQLPNNSKGEDQKGFMIVIRKIGDSINLN